MDNFKNIQSLIWDWNGTLLNDVEISILSMNQMLEKRAYPLLTVEKYLSIFTFPVQDYYVKAGVDFDEHEWDTVAMEFISNYRTNVVHASLHGEVKNILTFYQEKGVRQFILSAMEQAFLEETVFSSGINKIFEKVVGLNNHYAATKEDSARLLIADIGMDRDKICMIGDTIHDFEVAELVGIRCVLVSHGHQSFERLKETGTTVVKDFQELKRLF